MQALFRRPTHHSFGPGFERNTLNRICFYRNLVALSTCSLVLGFAAENAAAQVTFLGSVRAPGDTIDRSGLTGTLETGTPIQAFGGLSAIDYTGIKNRYLVLSDRGAGDGAASYPCRFHEVDITVSPSDGRVAMELVQSTLMTDAQQKFWTGNLAPLKAWDGSGHAPCLDPEGIRVLDDSRIVVSDEYGPSLDVFDRSGKLLRSISIPERYLLSECRPNPWTTGTYTNRGIEGVAITPDQKWVVGVMQGPLVQDGRIENAKCLGVMTRWLIRSLSTEVTKDWIYPLENESTGVSEVLAIDNQRFLVIERDSKIGSEAKIKKIFLADASQATDVSEVASLRDGIPTGHQAISKTLLIDLLDPEYGMSGATAPEKPEGLTWGPRLADGRRLLLVCFDNDFEPTMDTIIAAFAIDGL